eukprot:COSAG05_NODE_13235_length_437_cov_1.017751_1_plen_113_part_10
MKFGPPDMLTRTHSNKLSLAKAEYLAYMKIIPHLPKTILTPRVYAADFNFKSGLGCLMLEQVAHISYDFDAVDLNEQPTLQHFEKMMDTLATLHAHFMVDRKYRLRWSNTLGR